MENKTILPAEWYPQSAVQLTWPHEGTDWAPILDEVVPCFVEIAREVIKRDALPRREVDLLRTAGIP